MNAINLNHFDFKDLKAINLKLLIHVKELTQPQGHSTSGSHERYKSVERLQWEKDLIDTRLEAITQNPARIQPGKNLLTALKRKI